MLCIEGNIQIDGEFDMKTRDGAKLFGPWKMVITSVSCNSHIMIVEMAKY